MNPTELQRYRLFVVFVNLAPLWLQQLLRSEKCVIEFPSRPLQSHINPQLNTLVTICELNLTRQRVLIPYHTPRSLILEPHNQSTKRKIL